jgi:hypothetical protein
LKIHLIDLYISPHSVTQSLNYCSFIVTYHYYFIRISMKTFFIETITYLSNNSLSVQSLVFWFYIMYNAKGIIYFSLLFSLYIRNMILIVLPTFNKFVGNLDG